MVRVVLAAHVPAAHLWLACRGPDFPQRVAKGALAVEIIGDSRRFFHAVDDFLAIF